MDSSKLKISKLFYAVDGTKEPFESVFSAEDFADSSFTGELRVSGELLRVEEGVMLIMKELKATQTGNCSLCGKTLKLPLKFHESEWLFYEEKPLDYDDADELLFIDKKQMEIDLFEPVRQELVLNMDSAPRCEKSCVKFDGPEEKLKPLSGLKDLL